MNTSGNVLPLSVEAETLLASHHRQIYHRTDRMFAILMLIQWAAAICGACWLSPQTWSGVRSSVHPHVWLAIFFGGALCSLPVVLAWLMPGKTLTRHVIAVAQVLFSSLLIHISGGRIETHFHVFGSLAFLAAYRDWKVLLPPTIVVAADHLLRGAFWPETVFGTLTASPWRSFEHAGWVLFEDGFLIISIRQSVREMRAMASQTAQLESNQRQLRLAKEQAEAANAAKSGFLANMSHEIRTPLGGIMGFADVLRRGVGSPEQREAYLDTIHASGQHLLTLINDILDFSKIEAGRMECERSACSPHEILSDVLSILRVRAQEKNLRLECQWLTPAPETIVTDPDRLRQLLMNLTGNAIKFTETGGVTIRASLDRQQTEPRLVFEIQDTGIGIPAQHLERIFLPFDQADNSITRKYGGTGLGLAICREIVQALGGEITVQSNLGCGSTFRTILDIGPLDGVRLIEGQVCDALRPRPRPSQSEVSQMALPPLRILLVEDGETNRQFISLILTEAGASVVSAENGREGVELAQSQTFDLILMDMQMPIMDGYTAAQTLRSQGLAIPIFALTAHAMRGDQEKCLAAGCTGYISKPVQIDQLLETVRNATGESLPVPRSEELPREDIPQEISLPETGEDNSPIVSTLPTQLPKFQRIVENFVVKLGDKLGEIQTALETEDWEGLALHAHWLKGSGGTVGFDCITSPAQKLEQAAKQRDASAARQLFQDLRILADRIAPVSIS